MQFLFVDRILQLHPGESIKGIKHVTLDDYYLTEDEQGHLIFIPSLIGETLGQLAAWNVMLDNGFTKRPVAGIAASAKMYGSARPGQTLLLESFIDRLDSEIVEYHSQASVDDKLVFTLEGALGPLLPMEDFIAVDVVQRQFEEINRPGDWPPVLPSSHQTRFEHSGKKGLSLSFNSILNFEKGKSMVAEKRISRSAPWLADHFPHKPVLPMTVFMECNINLARDFLKLSAFSENYQLRELKKIKMNEFIQPGDVVTTTLLVKNRDSETLVLTFRSEVDRKRVCILEMLFETER